MAEGTHLTGPAAVTQLALGAAREWAASAIRVADEIEAEGFEAAQKGAIFDMITPADGQIERFVRSEAARRFPDHHFLGEEEGGGALDDDAWTWVVDPIDGTLNYATGLAGAASSIALVHGGEPVIGAIGDFSTHRVYSAAAGSGRVVCQEGTSESLVRPAHSPVGTARVFLEWGWEDLDAVMLGTLAMLAETRQRVVRMVGGAAYALLHVSLHGGAMLGIGLRLWDVAAGVVIAREAGLQVRLWQEGAATHVVAGSALDVRELAPIVEKFGSSRLPAHV
jgi:myo-inositol-1(or 4)-monophosphatase